MPLDYFYQERTEVRGGRGLRANGEIDAQLLPMALLKRLGPEKFFVRHDAATGSVREKATLSMENAL